jgi:hypothetical protein
MERINANCICRNLDRTNRRDSSNATLISCSISWWPITLSCILVETYTVVETFIMLYVPCVNSLALINSHPRLTRANLLIRVCRSRYVNDYWVGLNDLGTEAAYKWTDGSYYDYANWNNREPNDFNRQENCVHLIRSIGKWNDHHCQLKFSFICKAYNGMYGLQTYSR